MSIRAMRAMAVMRGLSTNAARWGSTDMAIGSTSQMLVKLASTVAVIVSVSPFLFYYPTCTCFPFTYLKEK